MSLNLEHVIDNKSFKTHPDECSICLDVVVGPLIKLNKCGHTFHQSCISCWFEKSNTCPLCRETILDIFKGKYLQTFCLGNKKKKIVIEFKPNKLIFYKLNYQKKNIVTCYQRTYRNLSLENNTESTDRNNITRAQSPELDLSQKNHILALQPNEKIGESMFQILYTDISKVVFCKKTISFCQLKVIKNQKKAVRSKKKKDILKVSFPNISLAKSFFETLKKRHQYFQDTNY